MQTVLCPTSDRLAAFQAGRLAHGELDEIAGHLETCAACQTAVQSASTVSDALLRDLKATGEDPYTKESACRRAVSAVEAIANADATQSRTDTASPRTSGEEGTGVRGHATDDIPVTIAPTAAARVGKYQLLEQIGQGGMGEVYKARHTVLNRIVAVKILPPDRLRSPDAVARFRREIEAAGRLDHPNIVRASDADSSDGQHFLVMEWLAGEDLAHHVKNHGPLPVATACDFIRQSALGLAYAHEHGMVHRDVKPSNLYLTKTDDGKPIVKVLDLGLALLHDAAPMENERSLTSTGVVMGTYDFIAPEQAMETHNVDHRADIYSLGCTFYYLLTGKVPFSGVSAAKKLLSHQMEEPTSIETHRTDIPPDVLAILKKMMAKAPAGRHASMREVAEALDKVTRRQGDKVTDDKAVTPSPLHPVTLSPHRPIKIAVASLLGLAAVVALVFGIIHITTPEGDYVIETDDPNFAFSVSKDTVILEDKLKKRTFHVKAVKKKSKGEWELEITDPANDTVVNALTLTIRRGEKAQGLKLWFEARDKAIVNKAGPVDDAWIKMVQSLPAEKQVDAVAAKLKDLNPGFDGAVTPEMDKTGVIIRLKFLTDNVTDISPVRALTTLISLDCAGSAPGSGKLVDLAPLKDLKLTQLRVSSNEVSDLSALKEMKTLDGLSCGHTKVTDLSPLKDLRPWSLNLDGSPISDLRPLSGMRLKLLNCQRSNVTNLSVLAGMPLKGLICDFRFERDAEIVRSIKSLESINGKPAAEFWQEVAAKTIDPAWLKQVAAMTPEKQLDAVAEKLKDLNPRFDGKFLAHQIDRDGVVRELAFLTDKVTNIAPVQALPGLRVLRIGGTPGNGILDDLSPLKSMKLTELHCSHTRVADLTPLADMKLKTLYFSHTPVAELSPLKGMPLEYLDCSGTKVTSLAALADAKLTYLQFNQTTIADLSPLKGQPLTLLDCDNTPVEDLTPLKGMKDLGVLFVGNTNVANLSPLKDMPLRKVRVTGAKVNNLADLKDMPIDEIWLDFKAERDTVVLKSFKNLWKVNGVSAAEFWKGVDTKALAVGEIRRYLGHAAGVRHVAFAPDGKSFLSVSHSEIWLWDVDGDTERIRFADTQGNLLCAGFSQDGLRVVGPEKVGSVAVWDATTKKGEKAKALHRFSVPSWAEWVAIAPDRPIVYYTNPSGGRAFDLDKKAELPMRFLGMWASLSKDGRRLLSADGQTLYLWDAETGKEISNVKLPGACTRMVLAQDGRHALAAVGKNVHHWDMIDKKEGKRLDTPAFVHSVAISPDGKRGLTGHADSKVRLWDLATGKELDVFENHTGAVSSVAFSPDGVQAITGSEDKSVRIWRLPPDVAEVKIESPIKAKTPSQGDVKLQMITKLDVKIDVEVRELRVTDKARFLSDVFFNRIDTDQWRKSDLGLGRVGVDQGNGLIIFIPLRQIKSIDAEDKQHVVNLVDGATLKGKLVSTVRSKDDKIYQLSDAASIKVIGHDPARPKEAKPAKTLLSVAELGGKPARLSSFYIQSSRFGYGQKVKMNVDGENLEPDLADFDKVVVTGADPDWRIRVTTVKGKEIAGKLDTLGYGNIRRWWFIGETPIGWLYVVSNYHGTKGFTLEKIKDEPAPKGKAEVGEVRTYLGHEGRASSVAFAPDGKSFLSGGPGEIFHWDLASSKPKQFFADKAKPLKTFGHFQLVTRIVYSKDGTHAISGGVEQPVRIWDVAKGQPVKHIELPKAASHFVAWSPDDKYLLVAPTGSFVRLFAYPSLEESNDRFGGTQGHFSKDGDKLLTLEGNMLQLYHLNPLKRTFVNVRDIHQCALTPDGRFAVCGGLDSVVYVWDMVAKKQVHKMTGHTGTIQALAISPDGKRALTGAGNDKSMRLWDLTKGVQIHAFEGHSGAIVSVAFSPDGRQALSAGSTDKSIKLWQLPEP